MTDTRNDLPPVNSPNFLEKVREALSTYLGNRGSKLDRGLTVRDLADAGLVDLNPRWLQSGGKIPPIAGPGSAIGGADVYEPDLTPPPTPSGFAATAAISNLLVECDAQTYTQGHGHAKSRLYGATWTSGALPVFADAVVITEFSGTVASHPTNPATTWHLWITWVTRDGVESTVPAGGTNGLVVTTGQDVSSLLDALTGQITQSQLYDDLGARIDLIDGSGVGSVNARLSTEASTRATQTGELYAKYTVKVDVAGLISGYGLTSTANNAAPTSSFGVRANAFFVAPPAVASATAPTTDLYDGYVWLDTSVIPNVTRYRSGSSWVLNAPALPFVVQATPTTVNGVEVPAGVYMSDAFIQNATITNAKIANLAVDDAKIANLSVSKLDAGSLKVGSYISSSNYAAGSQGFAIWANGNAEFNNATVRGTVYASSGSFTGNVSANSGSIGGNAIDASGMQSPNYAPGASGWRISSDGTARFMAGNIGAISINANGLNTGGFSGYAWPAAGQNGFHLGPNGMLVGNANNGKYLQLTSDGNIYTPGFNVINGTLTINQANVINTLNVAGNAITAVSAAIGPTGPSTGWPAYTALVMCTLSFYSTGAPILLFSGVQSVGGSNSVPYFGAFVRLVIDGGVRTETPLEVTTFNYGDGVYSSSFGGSYSFAPSYITDLGAGWHTAQLQLVTTSAIEPAYWSAIPIFSGATISTLETKR